MAVDLHLHTLASDGTLSAKELVDIAASLKLKAIAITDHDNVEAVDQAINRSKNKELEFIPAVELSSDVNGRDIHFLGYYINHHDPLFIKHLSNLREARLVRALKMVKHLQELGLEIYFKEVLEVAGEGVVGRPHVAQVLLQKGYIHSIQEAFDLYIGRNAPCYVEKYAYTAEQVIQVIRDVGGIAVLAHPGVSNVDESIPSFVQAGLQGLEIYHSEHQEEQVKYYTQQAEKFKLLKTGGSDCHGPGSGRGFIIGSVNVPDTCWRELKKAREGKA